MQSVSGAGWRGVKALRHENTEELFHGKLINNVLPHEKAELEEHAIQKDLHALFGCNVTATSFRVPVFVGHIASVRVEAKTTIDSNILPCSKQFDPRTMEDKREVSLGRVRVHQNTADLVVCGDQLLCGTAIPAVDSIVGT
jgi:aspartate-semialdehyde dehydrogenase